MSTINYIPDLPELRKLVQAIILPDWQTPNVGRAYFRRFFVPARYYSPIPELLESLAKPDLYFCDLCGRRFRRDTHLVDHYATCNVSPGQEIYCDPHCRLRIFEANGQHEHYTPTIHRLSLLAKLFLDHKMTFLDAESFTYYFLFEDDPVDGRIHFAGYISKELDPEAENNLACIALLPPYHGTGYGALLMHLSYELTRRERRVGGPERPITAEGRRAFTKVWKSLVQQAVIALCCRAKTELALNTSTHPNLTIRSISHITGMCLADVVSTLAALGWVRKNPETGENILFIENLPTKPDRIMFIPSYLRGPKRAR